MNKYQSIKENLELVIKDHQSKCLAQFLRDLRECFGMTRRAVCQDLDMTDMRLFWLENGLMRKTVYEEEIRKLAEYYGVDYEIMFQKAKNMVFTTGPVSAKKSINCSRRSSYNKKVKQSRKQ